MSRSALLIVIASLALVLAAGALVTQFAIPRKVGSANSAPASAAKSGEVGLRIGFVSVESAGAVFLTAVDDVRQLSAAKAQEVGDLHTAYGAGTVKEEQYQARLKELNAELVSVNISIYATVLDRMIASASFADMQSTLRQLRLQVQPLVDNATALVSQVKKGAMRMRVFQLRLSQVQAGYSQLEKVVNQVWTLKIQQAAVKVANAQGINLVLQQSGVLYAGSAMAVDLTEPVKAEIASYLK
jgi:Skp family chaperone for outer membrane proteins